MTMFNVITDRTRRAGIDGDAATVPGGVAPWEATTPKNTVAFPGALVSTSLTEFGSGTLTKEAADSDAPFQAQEVWRLVADGSDAQGVDFDGATGNVNNHSLQVYAKVTGLTGTCQLSFDDDASAVAITADAWTQITSEDVTPGATDLLRVGFTNGSSGTLLFQAAQMEEQPIATPITADVAGATEARGAGRIQGKIRDLLQPRSYAEEIALDSPTVSFTLGEAAGNVIDSVGGLEGVVVSAGARAANSAISQAAEDDTSKSYESNGTTSIITVADAAAIQNIWDGGRYIEIAFDADSDGENNQGRLLDKRGIGGGGSWELFIDLEAAGLVRVRFFIEFSGVSGDWATDVDIPIDQTIVVGVKYNADSVANNPTIYINGAPRTVGDGLNENSTPTGTRTTDVGVDLDIGNVDDGSRCFDGHLQHFNVFPPLSDARILEHANRAFCGAVQGWIAVHGAPGFGSSLEPGANVMNMLWADDATNFIYAQYVNTDFVQVRRRSTADVQAATSQALTLTKDTPYTHLIRWEAALQGVSGDGAAFDDAATDPASIPNLSATTLDIGTGGTVLTGRESDTRDLWVAGGVGTLDDDDSRFFNDNGDTPPPRTLFRPDTGLRFIWRAVNRSLEIYDVPPVT